MAEEKKEKLLKRNLKTKDLFSFTRIIKKMALREELKKMFVDVTGKTDKEKKQATQEMEINLFLLFIENIGNAEQEAYKFLGDLSGKKPKEIEDQAPEDTIGMIKELFSEEQFKSFLSLAVK